MHPAFQVEALTEEEMDIQRHIAQVFDSALGQLHRSIVPSGRYRNLMVTKMEEACFFAKKAINELAGEGR